MPNRDPLPGWPHGLSLPQTTSREIGRCLRVLCLTASSPATAMEPDARLSSTRHRTTRVGGSACCFGSALNARRSDWLLLPACSALIWRSRKRRRAPSNPGRFQNRPSAAPPPWAIPVLRFRISSTIWRRWSIWQKEKIQKRGRLGKPRAKRPRVSASQKARIFRSFLLQAIGGFQHTPLPMPRNLVPAGYFVSDTREVIPALALKWLLFDFGRRAAQLQAARADSFVANVTFTGAHQKLDIRRVASVF